MILHSDQGSVYASKAYNDLLPMYVVRSMSRAGTPTDNSAMESINGWIKAELFMDFHVTGERPVYEEVNEYIKFFNEERPAYALSYLTPKQYRERYAAYLFIDSNPEADTRHHVSGLPLTFSRKETLQ